MKIYDEDQRELCPSCSTCGEELVFVLRSGDEVFFECPSCKAAFDDADDKNAIYEATFDDILHCIDEIVAIIPKF